MNLPDISINRPVLALMLSLIFVLFGIISYDRIGVDRYPHIDFPMISVTTTLPGANAEIVDSSITGIIESAVNSTPGIDHIMSRSSPGVSVVVIRFQLDKNTDIAFNEVQAKVNQILRDLPDGTDPPVITKVEFGAMPILWITLSGDRTLQQLNQYARNVIRKRIEIINGVGEVQIGGERERVIRVNLDPQLMATYGLTPQDLLQAFAIEHVQLPGGFLVNGDSEFIIKLDLEFHDIESLKRLIVVNRGGFSIHLEDIAHVKDDLADLRSLARFNGEPTVGIGIVKVSGSNTVAIIEQVMERLETEIIPQLPPGIALGIASNDADLIQDIIDALEEHLTEGTLLTALVVWLFLKNIRSTLIITTAIPVSLLGTVALMYFMGFTFNTMTLLGLLLLIGVVVDDAIVVLENIYKQHEMGGVDPVEAAKTGTRQVVFAVLAATLTLVAIFAPVIFLGGIIGRFFQSFAVVVTFGVLVSLFVSLTLTPMLCSRYLKRTEQHNFIYHFLEKLFRATENTYTRVLKIALCFRWTVLFITLMIVLSSGYFFTHIGKGFMPNDDEGRFMVAFKTPLGSSIEYTAERMSLIENTLQQHVEIESLFSLIGDKQGGQVNSGTIIAKLIPRAQRHIHQTELINQLRDELAGIPGVQAFPGPLPNIGGERGEPLQFSLIGPDLDRVAGFAKQLNEQLAKAPLMGNVDLDLQLELPQINLQLARERIASLGLAPYDVALAINIMFGGLDVAKFNDVPGDGERYDIRLKAKQDSLTRHEDIGLVYLRTPQSDMVRLDNLVRFKPSLGPAVITRYDLQYAVNFFSTPTVSLSEAVDKVNELATEILPLGYQIKMKGRAEEFQKTAGYMAFAFITAVILIYMVLASQFNSFIQPLIIMAAQPLAIVGGVFFLWLFNHSLNIYSMIGLVLLIGLVAKNSILLVDLTNQLRNEGKEVKEALIEACPARMRPVLMTSFTMILALLPASLGLGAGADTNGPMAVAVIGGMISSTLLTLVVVPALYSLIERDKA